MASVVRLVRYLALFSFIMAVLYVVKLNLQYSPAAVAAAAAAAANGGELRQQEDKLRQQQAQLEQQQQQLEKLKQQQQEIQLADGGAAGGGAGAGGGGAGGVGGAGAGAGGAAAKNRQAAPHQQSAAQRKSIAKPKPASARSVPTVAQRPPFTDANMGSSSGCATGKRDFNARPVVIVESGAGGAHPPPLQCDIPCIHSGNADNERADVFIGWESAPGVSKPCSYQRTAAATMENYASRGFGGDYKMTTSLKSEVPIPYLSWFDFELMKQPRAKTQTTLATAFISNCGAPERKAVLSDLQQYGVTVDSFGGCMHNKDESAISNIASKYDRKVDIMSQYKFHLAFENSKLEDYVTEKYFLALQSGTVPVYLGAPNIADYYPAPDSVVHTDTFKSNKELAEYLIALAADEERYNKMLEWKKTGPTEKFKALMDLNVVHSICRMCIKVADDIQASMGTAHDSIVPEHRSVSRDIDHFLVRERNGFYYNLVFPIERTVESLHAAVYDSFKGYVPLYAREPRLTAIRPFSGEFHIYRIYPLPISAYDALLGDQALDTDDEVKQLKSGAIIEVIFMEN